MSSHVCQRCGYDSRCSAGNWSDRHPTAAVVLGMFTVMFSLVVVVGYPWLLAVAAVGAVVYLVDREVRRRRALAARADWEHRQITEAPRPAVVALPATPRRRHRRPRGADHWSATEPISQR